MADHIVINMPPYSDRYEFDFQAEFTNTELSWIKHKSGYQPATVADGLAAGDAELWCVLGTIALCRHHKISAAQVASVFDLLMSGPYTSTVEPEISSEAADADPTPPTNSGGKTKSSGPVSQTSSESPEAPPNGSGTPASAFSALPPARSGI